jgi:hypothetical protein
MERTSRPSLVLACAAALVLPSAAAVRGSDCSGTSTGLVPLTELGTGLYLDRFQGGLYPDGKNQPPAARHQEGLARAAAIQPLNAAGQPDPKGRIVLLSIGMSNTTQEFCSQGGRLPCDPWTFMGRARTDRRVDHAHLVIVDGARGGQTADTWDSPGDANYDRVRDTDLASRGLTEAQVQAVWVKVADARPAVHLPDPNADAYTLLRSMGGIARALMARYPNLQQAFFSSRIYAGYASTDLNPEPYAYESGFAVKWLLEAQIGQMAGGAADPIAGDLATAAAPWLAWGPYFWSDGLEPRKDGLIWRCADLQSDGTHPSRSGET